MPCCNRLDSNGVGARSTLSLSLFIYFFFLFSLSSLFLKAHIFWSPLKYSADPIQTAAMLKEWETPSHEQALGLLDARFADQVSLFTVLFFSSPILYTTFTLLLLSFSLYYSCFPLLSSPLCSFPLFPPSFPPPFFILSSLYYLLTLFFLSFYLTFFWAWPIICH